jgi:hypothetical protein
MMISAGANAWWIRLDTSPSTSSASLSTVAITLTADIPDGTSSPLRLHRHGSFFGCAKPAANNS